MAEDYAPRPLNRRERLVIERVLDVDLLGVAELLEQLDSVKVVSSWGSGSVSVDIEIVGDCKKSNLGSGTVPVDATVVDEDGALVGEILLWIEEGFLSGLEYSWYGDYPPTSLPDVGNIIVSLRESR